MRVTNHRSKLLDEIWKIQLSKNHISDDDLKVLADKMNISTIELDGVVSFYHYFHRRPTSKYIVYLNNSIISKFNGFSKIKQALETATGTRFEKYRPDGPFSLFETSCIGLSDMEPAALINFRPFTHLTPQKVHKIISDLQNGANIDDICDKPKSVLQYIPSGENAILLRNYEYGEAIKKLGTLNAESRLSLIKMGHLKGLGGAFFPTHFKWKACKENKASTKYVICNADEGEPGTFKDRFLLNNYSGMVLEGMIICAYTVGAKKGIIYLRAEYRYLLDDIENTIELFRKHGWLGINALGIKGFDFDIRVQLGAGAYICGEETALLQSLEGKRGEPRPKIHFPTEKGYHQKPTVVNNVETFCLASRIVELGPEAINNTGTANSPGTKLISVSGDCNKPGIYEIEWGMKVRELLELSEAIDPYAVQVSGPSGELISADEFDRQISLNDLRCGGSFMIFSKERSILDIIQNFNKFFVDESCGICTPCRAGNFILSRELRKIRRGLVTDKDLKKVSEWSEIMKFSSRCGLGQTAPNSIIQAFEKFPEAFEDYLKQESQVNRSFDLASAIVEYDSIIQNNHDL